jgi:hypothetical protein
VFKLTRNKALNTVGKVVFITSIEERILPVFKKKLIRVHSIPFSPSMSFAFLEACRLS